MALWCNHIPDRPPQTPRPCRTEGSVQCLHCFFLQSKLLSRDGHILLTNKDAILVSSVTALRKTYANDHSSAMFISTHQTLTEGPRHRSPHSDREEHCDGSPRPQWFWDALAGLLTVEGPPHMAPPVKIDSAAKLPPDAGHGTLLTPLSCPACIVHGAPAAVGSGADRTPPSKIASPAVLMVQATLSPQRKGTNGGLGAGGANGDGG